MAGGTAKGDSESTMTFTVESANRTLPLVKAIVGDIVTLHRDVSERRARLDKLRQRRDGRTRRDDPYREEVEQIEQGLDDDVVRLQSYVAELNEIGIELKDPAVGLVDFPTLMDGKQAFLCWKLGESEVQFWHSAEVGFANREPLNSRPTDHAV